MDLIETHAYWTSKALVSEKEEIKCYDIIKKIKKKMINFDDVIKKNIKEHNLSRPQITHYTYRILIIGGCRFWKTSSLFGLIEVKIVKK